MSAAKTEILGIKDLDDALNTIAWHLIRDTNKLMGDYAADVASKAQSNAARIGGVAKMAGRSVKPKRSTSGDGGSVTVGGSGTLPTGRSSFADVFFGAEWGGGSRPATRQFQPWQPNGYWFYPAVVAANRSRLDPDVDKLQTKALKYWAG